MADTDGSTASPAPPAEAHPTSPSRRVALRARVLAAATMVGGSACGVWLAGLVWFASIIPSTSTEDATTTDAIVVLTGGSGRLSAGLDLLAGGQAKRLFVSGVYRGVDVARLLEVSQRAPDDLDCCVEIGYAADDTAGNALETADWAHRNGVTSMRLVTASYHMPRSLVEFRRALPDVRLVPHPVFSDSFKRTEWWAWPGTFALVVSEYNKYLGSRVLQFLDWLDD